MTDDYRGEKPSYKGKSYKKYQPADMESPSMPSYHESSPEVEYDESPSLPHHHMQHHAAPKVNVGISAHAEVHKTVKKHKKKYDPGYMMKHKSCGCPPIVCDPQYVVRDCYIPREVPIIHPIVNVTRHNIVNVPRHYFQHSTKDEVVDPGCPGSGHHPRKKHDPGCGC